MKIKFDDSNIKYICNGCGLTVPAGDAYTTLFNVADSDRYNDKDFCLKCHPRRMTYRQLLEWLARGNGFLCQQAKDYSTAPTFSLSPSVTINGRNYTGKSDDQIPYDKHELVVSRFNDGTLFCDWVIPTLEMFERDCRQPKPVEKPVEKPKDTPKRPPLLLRPFTAVFGFLLGLYLGLFGLELDVKPKTEPTNK